MKQLQTNQRGAVSLITVILLAIILTIMTTGLLKLSIREQRQAIDDDLSSRAFYAAESGLNDAIRLAKSSPASFVNDDCDVDSPALPTTFDVAITCQLVDLSADNYQAFIGEGQTIQVPLLYSGGTPSSITIQWHLESSTTTSDTDGPITALRGNTQLPAFGSWGSEVSMLRTQFFSTPKIGGINRASITNNVGFFTPQSGGASPISLAGLDARVSNVTCDSTITGDYICQQIINGFDFTNRDYTLRLKSLYRSTHVQISFNGGILFDDVQALVDVTARASDVYRRVQARVDLAGTPNDALPDYALQSADSICKDILVTNTVSTSCP